MPVHPIEYRYGSPEMRNIFSLENRYRLMIRVEVALARAEAEVGLIPRSAAEAIESAADRVDLNRISEIEREIGHETMALVRALAEAAGEYGEYVHFGVTSNDILDTTTALQIVEASKIVSRKLRSLLRVLIDRGRDLLDVPALGRTHGMAALPIPFGFKFAVWATMVLRGLQRFESAASKAAVGKVSGAVGTMAALGGAGPEVQRRTMALLGLRPATITTQVVPRDLLADLILSMSLLSTIFDTIANEIRNLQRTEIGEVEEPFRTETQVGSSTMPHKKNPIVSEKVCGLARVMRGLSVAALENVVLEHERDLTNSSAERIILPEAFLIIDEQLDSLVGIMSGLRVRVDRIEENLRRAGTFILAERIMIELARRGLGRQTAHELIRKLAMDSYDKGVDLSETLKSDERVRAILGADLEELLDPRTYLGMGRELAERAFDEVNSFLRETS